MPTDPSPLRDTMRKLRDDAHERHQPQLAQMYGMRAVTLSLDKLTKTFNRPSTPSTRARDAQEDEDK